MNNLMNKLNNILLKLYLNGEREREREVNVLCELLIKESMNIFREFLRGEVWRWLSYLLILLQFEHRFCTFDFSFLRIIVDSLFKYFPFIVWYEQKIQSWLVRYVQQLKKLTNMIIFFSLIIQKQNLVSTRYFKNKIYSN